jgi:hypothetical protein
MRGFLILILATAIPTGGKTAGSPSKDRDPQPLLVADAGPIKRSAIVVEIELREVTAGKTRQILADFKFKNRSGRPKTLEKWLLLSPPRLEMDLLRVRTADGTLIPYAGPRRIRKILSTDYLTLLPGETRQVKDVDVTAAYDWPAGAVGLFVEYRGFSLHQNQTEFLESKSVTLNLH